MSASEDRGRIAKQANLRHEELVRIVKDLKERGYSNSDIAYIMRRNENVVRILLERFQDKGE